MRTVFSVLGFNVISCIRSIDLPVPHFRFLRHTIRIDVSPTRHIPRLQCTSMTRTTPSRSMPVRPRTRGAVFGRPHCPSSCFSIESNLAKRLRATSCALPPYALTLRSPALGNNKGCDVP
ncbi:hypothetical protein C8F01DRAFT_1122155 [Mycena amicta]|nr:hypothetical protein C8F01DRAFT_1122155 [Mycena amicta]